MEKAMKPATVVFLHGLNTFGDDCVHIGPLKLGRMDQIFKPSFEALGFRWLSIDGLGKGSPEVQAELAENTLRSHFGDSEEFEIHLIGHSMGGLVARALAKHSSFKRQIRSISTVSTPHQGTKIAEFAFDLAQWTQRVPFADRLMTMVNYRLLDRSTTFAKCSPSALKRFNREFPISADPPLASFTTATPLFGRSIFFWPLSAILLTHPNDGLVSLSDQDPPLQGSTIGPFNLDHFEALGLTHSTKGRVEFIRLIEEIHNWIQSHSN